MSAKQPDGYFVNPRAKTFVSCCFVGLDQCSSAGDGGLRL